MKNPIPHSTLFDTPTSMEDLHDWCMKHYSNERITALVASWMAINLCSRLVDAALENNALKSAKESVE